MAWRRAQRRARAADPPAPDILPAQRAQRRGAATARTSPDVSIAIARLATRQGGNVTRAQLRELQLSDSAITRRARSGALIPRFHGVFAVGHLAMGEHGLLHAALLAIGDDAALGHRTAAGVGGYLPLRTDLIHVLVAGRRPRSRPGLIVHETRSAFDIALVDGLRVTTPLRTLRDLAAVASRAELEAACSEALVRGHISQTALDRSGVVRAGTVAPTRGHFERKLYATLRSAGLPRPESNFSVGPYVPDFVWPAERVVLEADGYGTHGHRMAFERDRSRDAELAATGWVVVRITWKQLSDAPIRVATQLARVLALRGQDVGAVPRPH